MQQKLRKIGIVQNAPLAGDFPANLRAIVQGYRDCIDHGAELVVAPAEALCGLEPKDLATRASFDAQTRHALTMLSYELGSAPLILGAYFQFLESDDLWDGMLGEDDDDPQELRKPGRRATLVPYLVEKDTVTELEDGAVTDIDGCRVYVRIGEEDILPEGEDFDLMVHLACRPWHATAAEDLQDSLRWEASTNGTPVVYCAPVGTTGEDIYAGGSFIISPEGKTMLRLPFFETAAKVADLEKGRPCAALPTPQDLLRQALQRGIADTVKNSGYTGVCLPLDHPNAPLLAALCTAALGAAHVCGITFTGNTAPGKALGITCRSVDAAALATAAEQTKVAPGDRLAGMLTRRLHAALAAAVADDMGYMLLSPLARREIMMGDFTLYGDSCGALAPLGNLYEMDLHLLCSLLREENPELFGVLEEPRNPEIDRIIHEIADRNTAPSELANDRGGLFREDDVRQVQRRLITSALNRTQIPMVLHVDSPAEQLRFPVFNRMND